MSVKRNLTNDNAKGRTSQFFGKVARSTYNNERFEDLPPEVIYAEVLMLEI
jgi:hypothetical protein